MERIRERAHGLCRSSSPCCHNTTCSRTRRLDGVQRLKGVTGVSVSQVSSRQQGGWHVIYLADRDKPPRQQQAGGERPLLPATPPPPGRGAHTQAGTGLLVDCGFVLRRVLAPKACTPTHRFVVSIRQFQLKQWKSLRC